MELNNLVANAAIKINVPVNKVWDALVNPELIKKYMFGTTVNSDWKVRSNITWKGTWQGKSYEDKGEILSIIRDKQLQYTHFSSLTGDADKPENYHTVTIDLSGRGDHTFLSLSQDNNRDEQSSDHAEKNWAIILESMKKILENYP